MRESLSATVVSNHSSSVSTKRAQRLIPLLVALAFLFGLRTPPLWAQDTAGQEQGLKPYGTFHGGDIDEISMVNGKLTLKIPLVSYPQRGGKLPVGFSLIYHNPEYQMIDTWQSDTKPYYWEGTYWYGYQAFGNQVSAYNTAIEVAPDFNVFMGCAVYYTGQNVCEQYGVYEPDGVLHQMGQLASGNWISLDATGYILNPTTKVVTDREGTQYTSQSINSYPYVGKVEDANGNLITSTSTGWTDSVGRSIPAPWPCGIMAGGQCMTTDYSGCLNRPLSVSSAVVWTLPGVNSGTATFKFCFASALGGAVPPGCAPNPPPGNYCSVNGGGGINLQTVVLPDGTTWDFQYDTGNSGTGALTKIIYPTGASISYTWGWNNRCLPNNKWWYYGLSALTRTVDANDGTGPHTWTYGQTGLTNGLLTTVTDPLGNASTHAETSFATQRPCSMYETQEMDYQGSSTSGTLLKTITTAYNYTPNPYDGAGPFPTSINVAPTNVTTQYANGQTRKTAKTYDSGIAMTGNGAGTNAIYGLVTAEQEYDYANGAPGPLLRTTSTNYLALSNSNYLANNLLTLPSSVKVTDGSGTQRKYTTYAYDAGTPLVTGIGSPTHDLNPPDGSYRGNLTSVSRWLNDSTTSTTKCPISVSNGYLVSYSVYNDTGTVDHSVDSCGSNNSDQNHKTTYSYSTTPTCSPNFLGAFPTVITNALGQATNYCYDLNTGLKTSVTDPNSQTTSYQYDVMLRPTQITYPLQQVNGAPVHGLTTITYPSNTEAQMTELMDNHGNNRTSYLLTDGLHRELRHLVTNGETVPYDEVDMCYDAVGNGSFKSYPYQSSGPATGENCSKPGDSFLYDSLHRTTSVIHSDNTSRQTKYTDSSNHTGRATTVTDESGVQRISQVDGLGRLTSVCEVSGNLTVGISGSQTASACSLDISGTGFLTTYGYDALDNLASVTQGPLNPRSFMYDSLSQLTKATNPESGAICYGTVSGGTCQQNGYDANGNLITKTDARGTAVTYAYDYVNRLMGKTYSDTTPAVTYGYDQTSAMGVSLTNTIGRRSSMSTAGSNPTGSVFSYDAVGRVLNNSQCTPQNCSGTPFSLTYAYDLIGDMLTSTNGLGLTLTSTVNAGGRLTSLSNSATGFGSAGTLLGSPNVVHYNAAGAMLTASLGNGINETRTYDGRLRLAGITDGSLYTLTIPASGGYAGNGNILTANDSVNGNWTYSYDAFNRLATATVTGQAYTYAYDRFGNRWQQNGPHSSSVGFDANNHIVPGNGVTYDADGNTTNDGSLGYTYDAEGRIATAGSSYTYTYDAGGRRVRKASAANTLDFLYDAAGNEIAQVSSIGTWMRGEIYADGHHLATYNNSTTYFNHTDWLGTERARSTSAGALYETCTSLPFGDGLTCSGGDPSPMHFTGKERDTESGLDNFGARYDSSQYGRFMTPDWSAKPQGVPYATLNNPQSLNLYSYVQNNPETNRDVDGHFCIFGVIGTTCSPRQEGPPPPRPPPPAPPQFVKDNPTFRTPNQAGVAAARKDQQGQQETGAEHGNNVFGEPGAYTYTDPVTQGQQLTVDQNNTTGVSHTKTVDLRKAPIPPGTDLVGEAHSHRDNIGFGPSDVQRAHDQTIPSMGHPSYQGMYLGLPNGNVVKYDPRTGQQTTFGPGE